MLLRGAAGMTPAGSLRGAPPSLCEGLHGAGLVLQSAQPVRNSGSRRRRQGLSPRRGPQQAPHYNIIPPCIVPAPQPICSEPSLPSCGGGRCRPAGCGGGPAPAATPAASRPSPPPQLVAAGCPRAPLLHPRCVGPPGACWRPPAPSIQPCGCCDSGRPACAVSVAPSPEDGQRHRSGTHIQQCAGQHPDKTLVHNKIHAEIKYSRP